MCLFDQAFEETFQALNIRGVLGARLYPSTSLPLNSPTHHAGQDTELIEGKGNGNEGINLILWHGKQFDRRPVFPFRRPTAIGGEAMYGYMRVRRGEQAPNAKLSAEKRHLIRQRRQEGASYKRIADEMGICKETVRKLDQGVSYQEDD
jgi:Sigma-70, region 4